MHSHLCQVIRGGSLGLVSDLELNLSLGGYFSSQDDKKRVWHWHALLLSFSNRARKVCSEASEELGTEEDNLIGRELLMSISDRTGCQSLDYGNVVCLAKRLQCSPSPQLLLSSYCALSYGTLHRSVIICASYFLRTVSVLFFIFPPKLPVQSLELWRC